MIKENQSVDVCDKNKDYFFDGLIDNFSDRYRDKNVLTNRISQSIKNSLTIDLLTNNLAEVFRVSKTQIENDLIDFGLKDLVEQYRLKNLNSADDNSEKSELFICSNGSGLNPFPELFKVKSKPDMTEKALVSDAKKQVMTNVFESVQKTFLNDPFTGLYRENVLEYFNDFMANTAPVIDEAIKNYFGGNYPKYMVNVGIGANEQFSHYVSRLNNNCENKRLTWIVVNSTKALLDLPSDATVENTLFLEFSRSGFTEETVKVHEYTPRNAKRIVFANKGALRELGERDNNLVLELPDEVSGRFGRNKTPILLAPMYIAGMDVESFWKDIDSAIKAYDLSNPDSLPNVIGKYLVLYQDLMSKNFIYLGCNDDVFGVLCDEFIQYWNEGVNKNSNDFLMSRFFGLPRDSHMNIEGVLANKQTKMGIFVLRTDFTTAETHPLISHNIDPISPSHEGLQFGDEEVVFSYANYKRFSEVMPSLLFEIPSKPTLKHSAILGQLFADITYVYSRLKGIDPGSNPEVKFVRERSADLLSKLAGMKRDNPDKSADSAIFE